MVLPVDHVAADSSAVAALAAASAAFARLDQALASHPLRGCGANVRHADKRVRFAALPPGSEYRVPDSGRSSALDTETPQTELSFTDAVHQFNAGDRDRRVAELLEP
jgi:hypothetical protein